MHQYVLQLLLLPLSKATTNLHFQWDTLATMQYTFCFNASGPFSPAAVDILSKQPMMIHGMNAMQELDPPYRASENKTIRAAKQLLAANPSQQQLYTIQSDFTRNIYNSGEWFNANPECMLKDKNGALVNISTPNQKWPICGTMKDPVCHAYGFQTQCGRDAWVDFAVETVEAFGDAAGHGVFIDGFQGCDPYAPGAMDPTSKSNPCGRLLANTTKEQQVAWISGFNESLWELRRRLGKNRTIICNFTGRIYSCNGKVPCFCDGGNEERFYGGQKDVAAVVENAASANPGAIIHVPHIDSGGHTFNKGIAGFLVSAGANTGVGTGFGYDCDQGAWLRPHPELHKAVGLPKGPPVISKDGMTFTREFQSGTKVYYDSTLHTGGSCILWSDGSKTVDGEGCPY